MQCEPLTKSYEEFKAINNQEDVASFALVVDSFKNDINLCRNCFNYQKRLINKVKDETLKKKILKDLKLRFSYDTKQYKVLFEKLESYKSAKFVMVGPSVKLSGQLFMLTLDMNNTTKMFEKILEEARSLY